MYKHRYSKNHYNIATNSLQNEQGLRIFYETHTNDYDTKIEFGTLSLLHVMSCLNRKMFTKDAERHHEGARNTLVFS